MHKEVIAILWAMAALILGLLAIHWAYGGSRKE